MTRLHIVGARDPHELSHTLLPPLTLPIDW
jgi:hypothetical protein